MNVQVGPGAGILTAFCEIVDPNENDSNDDPDFQPIAVISYQIIELDGDLTPIKIDSQSNLTLTQDSKIVFSSLTAAQSNVTSGGLQATVVGINAEEQKVQLNWLVKYSNICNLLPYSSGDAMGWMSLMSSVSDTVMDRVIPLASDFTDHHPLDLL